MINIDYYPSELPHKLMQNQLGFNHHKKGLIVAFDYNTDDYLLEGEEDILGCDFTHAQLKYQEGSPVEDYVTREDILEVINHSMLLLIMKYLDDYRGNYDD